MKDGFLKAAAFSPALRVADCTYNAQQILEQLQAAAQRGVKLAVFPEFCLTGYTCGDLFLQRTLQQGALDALEWLLAQTRTLDTVALVGLPLLVHGKLYNCAAVLCRGQLLGIVPKTYLPNYGEFYEKRQFTPGNTEVELIEVCGQQVPFGTSLLFRCRQMPSFVLGVELCEDLWSALPPSTFHALAGATVIANLSASDETVGKAEYRRALVANQSARLLCGYLYASAGHGESTTDMVFAGHDLIAEDGSILAETAPFAGDHAETELDCQRMEAERARNTSFEPSAEGYVTVEFDLAPEETVLTRRIDPAPFVPGDPQRRAARCELILKMQADGLAKRLDEIVLPDSDESILLDRHSEALHLIERLRDEAHRFAITHHRALRQKKGVGSKLEEIPGIGPRRRRAILTHFKTMEALRSATEDEIADVDGVTRENARAVYRYLHADDENSPSLD